MATHAAVVDIELPPQVQRVAEQIERGFRRLASSESIAAYICSTGEVSTALAALGELELQRAVLAQLTARHFAVTIPDRWNSGVVDIKVCNACRSAWPCEDAVILGVEE